MFTAVGSSCSENLVTTGILRSAEQDKAIQHECVCVKRKDDSEYQKLATGSNQMDVSRLQVLNLAFAVPLSGIEVAPESHSVEKLAEFMRDHQLYCLISLDSSIYLKTAAFLRAKIALPKK